MTSVAVEKLSVIRKDLFFFLSEFAKTRIYLFLEEKQEEEEKVTKGYSFCVRVFGRIKV